MNVIDNFLEESSNKYTIYCDLDGVLVDWDKAVKDLGLGYAPDTIAKKGEGYFWAMLHKAGESFWANMEWTKDGKELWDFIKPFKPTILSAPTTSPTSRTGKVLWVKTHLGPTVKLILEKSHDKHVHSNPDAILIDDRESNIADWKNAGGIGILHSDSASTIRKLKRLLES